jgi:hypothetical protein
MTLSIKRMTLYKHGLGFFERGGRTDGESLRLEFPRRAMDDVLKSLVAIDREGRVLGLEFETPEDRNRNVARPKLELSDDKSLTELLNALKGRAVRLEAGADSLEGLVVGVELEEEDQLKRGLVVIFEPELKRVSSLRLDRLERLSLLDDVASSDLMYALRAASNEEERASAVLQLSKGSHDLSVSYIAPAPAWRVSYRLISDEKDQGSSRDTDDDRSILLQAWGLFDNTLEEDLINVQLTLMAGMPVSFRYALHQPNTPERPMVEDEERTVSAPVMFDAMEMEMERGAPLGAAMPKPSRKRAKLEAAAPAMAAMSFGESLEQSVTAVADGADRGSLFAYRVRDTVSVARGRSAMVPLASARIPGRRELLYNRVKHPKNPVASLRFKNESGLTLERGPVTVLEGSDYAGEAVIDFTPSNAEMIVAFAIELGVRVTETFGRESRLSSLFVRDGYLLIEEFSILKTSYELKNSLERTVDVILEHPRANNTEIFDTPDAIEENAKDARWKVPCAPATRTSFVVQERQRTSRYETVRSLDGDRLKSFLKDKFLEEKTFKGLEGALALYRQADAMGTQLEAITHERNEIFARQKQIQGNLNPLGRDGDEGKLRARYIKELERMENRLNELERDEKRVQQEVSQLEGLAARAIEALEKN